MILIGDSITNNYDKAQPPDQDFQLTWNKFYAPRGALNLGFSGDTTANVLWRLNHGEVNGLHPKVAIVLIGTNNTGHDHESALETELGIDAVVADLEERLPQTHILLLGILPSGISDEKTAADNEVNRYLATCYGENARVAYLDIGSIFFDDGHLRTEIYYDPRLPQHGQPLHPDTQAQRMMADAIESTLARLMADKPAVPLDTMSDIDTALIPVPWIEQDSYDWYARHHAVLSLEAALLARQSQPRMVLVGDSITHFWSGSPVAVRASGPLAWDRVFGASPTLNLGFGWDRTENVLWRLRQGELRAMRPQNVVVNIGTNNLTGTSNARANTPAETAEAIEAICREVHAESPGSRVYLMAIFPRGAAAFDPLRLSIAATNKLLSAYASQPPQHSQQAWLGYLDIGQQFLHADGTLNRALLPDGTHPNEDGYQIWATALIQAGVTRGSAEADQRRSSNTDPASAPWTRP